jgi:hypothetical protein
MSYGRNLPLPVQEIARPTSHYQAPFGEFLPKEELPPLITPSDPKLNAGTEIVRDTPPV